MTWISASQNILTLQSEIDLTSPNFSQYLLQGIRGSLQITSVTLSGKYP